MAAHGDAILVGNSVTNSGTLSAPNGTADMAAGNEIVLQPVGSDPRIAVSGGTGSVTNSGTVAAARAALRAAGGDVYALVENHNAITATGTKTIKGQVWLTAGGTAQVASPVTATNANGSGGAVTVNAGAIHVTGTIDASATKTAKNGGAISVVATGDDAITGTLLARPGTGGTGGTIETSGATLEIGGATVDAGAGGQWLLDPAYDLTVDATAASTIDASLNGGTGVSLVTTATSATG
ncbi:MAG: hypothetical protein ACREE3_07045, partial [Stellaceae bacterium]